MEGGSANDYDYAAGDPVNNFDLDGEAICQACADFASGVLDSVTVGAGEPIERALGIHSNVRHASGWREAGSWAGMAVPGGGAVMGVGKIASKAGIKVVARRFPNVGGAGIDVFRTGVRLGGAHWHRIQRTKGGPMQMLPHYHRRPGIGNHRPWQGRW
ncbi:MAG: hypothetical protein ACRDHY_02250 [Anaerolineales bacterium]